MFLLDLFKPASHKPEITDSSLVEKKYNHWRYRIFYATYIGYALYYLTRKSLTFTMPALMADLGFDKAQLGLLSTLLASTYGISKFISGILADKSNIRYFMAFGLLASGLVSILFGCASSFYLFAIFWSLNGWFQGFGWPSCTRILTQWYSKSERGRWWSSLSTSLNVGGAITPFIVAYCAQAYGWRAAMIVPGTCGILGGLFLINRLADSPQSLGLPAIEKFNNEANSHETSNNEQQLSIKEILFNHVLNSPFIWISAVIYFFIYLTRQAIGDWTTLYLIETKGYSTILAGSIIFWFEMGGILGGLLAGWASDRLFAGNRGPITVLFSILSLPALFAFKMNVIASPFIDAMLIVTIGMLLFGPLILIGIAVAEHAHKKASATATGFIGWTSYLGAATAGYPLGRITQIFGWDGFFVVLTGSAIIAALLALFLYHGYKKPVPVQQTNSP